MRKNIIGQKFGKLLVIEYSRTHVQPSGQKKSAWLCECECGNRVEVYGCNLKKKSGTVSCGCEKKKQARKMGKKNEKHGLLETLEYNSWYSMKIRCYNPNTKYYKHYGGRGIKVCDEWRNDFLKFLSDMGKRPSPEYSLDRVDVNGNYEPKNCRWATPKEQIDNRRK